MFQNISLYISLECQYLYFSCIPYHCYNSNNYRWVSSCMNPHCPLLITTFNSCLRHVKSSIPNSRVSLPGWGNAVLRLQPGSAVVFLGVFLGVFLYVSHGFSWLVVKCGQRTNLGPLELEVQRGHWGNCMQKKWFQNLIFDAWGFSFDENCLVSTASVGNAGCDDTTWDRCLH